jgi:hypothetical protein
MISLDLHGVMQFKVVGDFLILVQMEIITTFQLFNLVLLIVLASNRKFFGAIHNSGEATHMKIFSGNDHSRGKIMWGI